MKFQKIGKKQSVQNIRKLWHHHACNTMQSLKMRLMKNGALSSGGRNVYDNMLSKRKAECVLLWLQPDKIILYVDNNRTENNETLMCGDVVAKWLFYSNI